MSVPGSWKVLPLRVGNGIPLLLTSFTFCNFSYTVYITDLSNVWVESLNRKQICMRGFQEDTSIDPSDGDENMTAFLKSLTRAFDDATVDHQKTSITVSPGGATHTDGDGGKLPSGREDFTLTVTCQLPEKLTAKPLKWNMYLSKCPSPKIASCLVLPLVEAQRAKTFQVDSLFSTIYQKDAVITRLLDKLEAIGNPLENIFTVASNGKRKLTRKVAEENIKGLAPFNRKKWMDKVKAVMPKPTDVAALLEDTLDDVQLERSSVEVANAEDMEDWWLNIAPGSGAPRATPRRKHRAPLLSNLSRQDETARDELWNDSLRRYGETEYYSTEGPVDAAFLPSALSRQQSAAGKSLSRQQTTESQFKQTPARDDDSATASEDDDGFESKRPATPPPLASVAKMEPPSSSPIKPYSVKRFTGLGRIGGRPRPVVVDNDATMSLDEDSSPVRPAPQPKTPLPRFGKISGSGVKRVQPKVDFDATLSMSEDESPPSLPQKRLLKMPTAPNIAIEESKPPSREQPTGTTPTSRDARFGVITGAKRQSNSSPSPPRTTKNPSLSSPKATTHTVQHKGHTDLPREPEKPVVRRVGGHPLVKRRRF
ncbi:hypothetical protein BROUX41_003031 [Berkeleyomyces rouxiae]|uniref:uncharacterized protein n=1 Tax=Berkeleyomyces rouxiae TaxID=2035830 RepID=UPI003B77F00A